MLRQPKNTSLDQVTARFETKMHLHLTAEILSQSWREKAVKFVRYQIRLSSFLPKYYSSKTDQTEYMETYSTVVENNSQFNRYSANRFDKHLQDRKA